MSWKFRCLSCLILVTLMGCSGLPLGLGNAIRQNTPLSGSGQPTSSTITPEGKGTPIPITTETKVNTTQEVGRQLVRIWLPPEFDPNVNNNASAVLKARLDQFLTKNPGMALEVRVKGLDGPGGMLESLVAASAAAPEALPDLVLLPRWLLESAALKGLLYPYDGLTSIMEDQNWFEYAHQLAQIKASTYGIPFASDIMVLAHTTTPLVTISLSLEDTLSQNETLLFPAADPQALFTVCMYLAGGGSLQDGQGRPVLEEKPLSTILEYYQRASIAEIVPYTLTQYADDTQVLEALLGGQSSMAVLWASTYLRYSQAGQGNLSIAPLPTPNGDPFTLATGWSWALAGQDSGRRALSIRLAEYLVDKGFLAEWTWAAGYLPPRVDALENWPVTETNQVIKQILNSASLVPSADLVSIIGPALQQAVVDVLARRSDVKIAVQEAIEKIKQP